MYYSDTIPGVNVVNHYFQIFLTALGVNERRKARNLLVKPALQLKLPFYILLLTASFLFMVLLLGNLYLDQTFVTMIETTTQSEYLQQEIATQIAAFRTVTLLLLLVYAILVVIISSVYTHRFLGPMIPIGVHLKALKDGFYAHRLHLRKNDALHDLASQLNDLAEALENRK